MENKEKLNDIIKNLEKYKILTVCGKPKSGKTTFCVNFAKRILAEKKRVIYYTLDEDIDTVANRFNVDITNKLNIVNELEFIPEVLSKFNELGLIVIDNMQILEILNKGRLGKDLLLEIQTYINNFNVPFLIVNQLDEDQEVKNDKSDVTSEFLQNNSNTYIFLDNDYIHNDNYIIKEYLNEQQI